MAVVVFAPEDFRQDFPQFADPAVFTGRRLQGAFNAACLILDNSEASPVPYDPTKGQTARETLLYHLTCHILTMALWGEAGQSGPVNSASEGSVSASFATAQLSDKSYFLETPCGRTFWQMLAMYRVGGRYCAVKHHHPWG
ncbi:DUF4054 domain-containing protein [Desulfovibrio sp. OttesenSCG-928-A18]|nr:DUF4054 domain-containing protein [Desulfovibrio sp. OttesenSCG-928-A18]